jgi:hypothetical protein
LSSDKLSVLPAKHDKPGRIARVAEETHLRQQLDDSHLMLLIASVVQPDEHEPVRAVLAAGADRPNVDRPRFVPECE